MEFYSRRGNGAENFDLLLNELTAEKLSGVLNAC